MNADKPSPAQEANTMQSERKIYADINSAGDIYITVTLSGEGVLDLTEPQIEAALSTDAEPVAYGVFTKHKHQTDYRFSNLCSDTNDDANELGREYFTDQFIIKPLYAEPVKTAPAVAVKALEWSRTITDYGHSLKAYDPFGRQAYHIRVEDGTTEEDIAKAKAEKQADYEARILSALSAQVHGVAGWQDFCNAPKDGTKFDAWYPARLGLEGYRRVDVYWSDIQDTFCTDGSFGPEEPCPILMHPGPTHYMHLPASPASKHGDAE